MKWTNEIIVPLDQEDPKKDAGCDGRGGEACGFAGTFDDAAGGFFLFEKTCGKDDWNSLASDEDGHVDELKDDFERSLALPASANMVQDLPGPDTITTVSAQEEAGRKLSGEQKKAQPSNAPALLSQGELQPTKDDLLKCGIFFGNQAVGRLAEIPALLPLKVHSNLFHEGAQNAPNDDVVLQKLTQAQRLELQNLHGWVFFGGRGGHAYKILGNIAGKYILVYVLNNGYKDCTKAERNKIIDYIKELFEVEFIFFNEYGQRFTGAEIRRTCTHVKDCNRRQGTLAKLQKKVEASPAIKAKVERLLLPIMKFVHTGIKSKLAPAAAYLAPTERQAIDVPHFRLAPLDDPPMKGDRKEPVQAQSNDLQESRVLAPLPMLYAAGIDRNAKCDPETRLADLICSDADLAEVFQSMSAEARQMPPGMMEGIHSASISTGLTKELSDLYHSTSSNNNACLKTDPLDGMAIEEDCREQQAGASMLKDSMFDLFDNELDPFPMSEEDFERLSADVTLHYMSK